MNYFSPTQVQLISWLHLESPVRGAADTLDALATEQ